MSVVDYLSQFIKIEYYLEGRSRIKWKLKWFVTDHNAMMFTQMLRRKQGITDIMLSLIYKYYIPTLFSKSTCLKFCAKCRYVIFIN